MSKVITFSRVFPAYHPKAGQPTNFPEKIWNNLGTPLNHEVVKGLENINRDVGFNVLYPFFGSLSPNIVDEKHHTIRGGNRWKARDWFSPRVWSDKPYNSKQIIIAPDIQLKRVVDIKISNYNVEIYSQFNKCWCGIGGFNDFGTMVPELCKNDGLSKVDFKNWFNKLPFSGQILIWSDKIKSYS